MPGIMETRGVGGGGGAWTPMFLLKKTQVLILLFNFDRVPFQDHKNIIFTICKFRSGL